MATQHSNLLNLITYMQACNSMTTLGKMKTGFLVEEFQFISEDNDLMAGIKR